MHGNTYNFTIKLAGLKVKAIGCSRHVARVHVSPSYSACAVKIKVERKITASYIAIYI